MKYIKVLSYGLGLSFMLSSCGLGSTTSVNVEKNIGYFVSNFNDSVEYHCENKRQSMNDSGKFECASFPIAFYMDNTKIGEISNIHEDGYVYPQDIIILEARAPVYTSESSMSFLTVE
jgi:hypothetical protein